VGEVGQLPAHITEANGEKQMQPCAEIWLTDRAASIKGRDAVRVVALPSVNVGKPGLAGRW
jgi:hypothetical protein